MNLPNAARATVSISLLVLAACGARDDGSTSIDQAAVKPKLPQRGKTALEFANPVVPHAQGGMADPGVLKAAVTRYYVVSTGGAAALYRCA